MVVGLEVKRKNRKEASICSYVYGSIQMHPCAYQTHLDTPRCIQTFLEAYIHSQTHTNIPIHIWKVFKWKNSLAIRIQTLAYAYQTCPYMFIRIWQVFKWKTSMPIHVWQHLCAFWQQDWCFSRYLKKETWFF